MTGSATDAAVIRAILAQQGLVVSPEVEAELAAIHPVLRALIARLETGLALDSEPAVQFRA